MSQNTNDISKNVSIVILTRNAGQLFDQVLCNIFRQEYRGNFEVIIIDSASTDNTVQIAKKYRTKIINIDQENFGHGKTRNYAARVAQYEFVVMLTQDAVPINTNWLTDIISGLDNEKIIGTYGRQIARSNAVPMEKFYYQKMYGTKKIIWSKSNIRNDEIIFSNANSAFKRNFLIKHPFCENILMCEDRDWAISMIDQNYKILYNPLAKVSHSHDTTPISLFKRYFDFGVSLFEIYKNKTQFVGKGMLIFFQELKYLIKNRYYCWIPQSVLYNLMKFMGLYLGGHHNILPKYFISKFSNYKGYWK